MKPFVDTCIRFFKKETVLCVAGILAFISAFFVHPSAAYIGYIDFRVLSLLFCLMLVVAGFQSIGLFHFLGSALLTKVRTTRQLILVLSLLCFFSSMFITNDVALLTFDNYPFSMLMDPTVTAVEVDMYDMGVNAARFVLQRVRKPNLRTQSYVTSPCILEREST